MSLACLARLIAETAAADDAEKLAEAEALMVEDLQASRQLHTDDHTDTLAALSNLAQLHYKRGTLDDSLPLAREAAGVCARLLGQDDEQTVLLGRLIRSIESSMEQERAGQAQQAL